MEITMDIKMLWHKLDLKIWKLEESSHAQSLA
jgi:hypothetical protein